MLRSSISLFFNDNKKIGMFEPKQIIEGKIFIHQRWAEALQYSQNCFPAGFRMLYSVFSIGFVFPFAAPYLY